MKLMTSAVLALSSALGFATLERAQAQTSAQTDNNTSPPFAINVPDWLSLHAQDTDIEQFHPAFTSPVRGPNSLNPGARGDETVTATLYLGARIADGWSVYADPEIDQGFGLSNTTGVAGFVNGEGAKVGAADPYFRLQRLFTRYEIGLGGDSTPVMSDQNQVAETRQANNLIITAGKFNVTDVFDNNDYAHDPTSDFLNWSIIDAGAFDYPADAWGYSYGASAELALGTRTFRAGIFDLSRIPNGAALYRGFGSFGAVTEIEQRFNIASQAGSIKFLAFLNRGDMANYTDAVRYGEAFNTIPQVAPVRSYSNRTGFELNAQQAVTDDFGLFARASINDGHKEAYEFTDINRSLSAGVSLKGGLWSRANDSIGAAFVINEISPEAQEYFADGGLGILIGDGSLAKYQPEQILETYYDLALKYGITLALDDQFIANPAYNATRGPVDVIGARFHIAY